ncbi:DUF6177 family protein [Nocardiopsis sp. CC223A]|uniref:DUF6177 family protein n=1 Tax=Nocardiopsis sp. CC223A TaxID=3044051 RepID=UPI00278BB81F|nr:DUF6177 family protein [Nocardiopsis sp. CC223A]
MTHDVVALLDRAPTLRGMTQALVHAGPELRVRAVADGALVQLRDDAGRMIAAVQAAQRLSCTTEIDRLLTPGLGRALAERPYWVEARGARTGAQGPDTRAIVRRFADALVEQCGGTVWSPDPAPGWDDPVLTGVTDHPTVTVTTPKVAVAVQDRPVVAMDPWMVDALHTHAHARLALQLVTPSASRLTHILRSALTGPFTRWVVRTPRGDYRDGFSGAPLTWHEELGFVRAERPPDDEQATERESNVDTRSLLLVDLSVIHPPERDLRLGTCVETLTLGLTGSLPALWGTSEPAPLVWSPDDLTGLARRRAPKATWTVFNGPTDHDDDSPVFTGTLRVTRVPEGVREDVTLAIGGPADTTFAPDTLTPLVKELTGEDGFHRIAVHRTRGRADLAYAPDPPMPVIPIGLGIGPAATTGLGVDHAQAAPVRGVPFGPPMTPCIWYAIGDGTDPADLELHRSLLAHLRPGSTKPTDQ